MPDTAWVPVAAIDHDSSLESGMATPPGGITAGDDMLRFEECIAERLRWRKPYFIAACMSRRSASNMRILAALKS